MGCFMCSFLLHIKDMDGWDMQILKQINRVWVLRSPPALLPANQSYVFSDFLNFYDKSEYTIYNVLADMTFS